METLTVNVLTADEFDKLVRDHSQQSEFEFIPAAMANNDSSYLYRNMDGGKAISPTSTASEEQQLKWWQNTLDNYAFWESGKADMDAIGIHAIIDGFIRKGVLRPGNYIVTVSW